MPDSIRGDEAARHFHYRRITADRQWLQVASRAAASSRPIGLGTTHMTAPVFHHGLHSWTVSQRGGDDCPVDPDRGAVYLLETAKDWLARGLPGYRIEAVDSFLSGVLAELRGGVPPSAADVRAVTFPLTKWHTGYAPRDVDRLLGELAQLVQRPGAEPAVPLAVRELVDRIRHSRFATTRRGGYEEEEVDQFLDRIVRDLIGGERGTMRQLAGEARFTTVRYRPAYVMADVDDLLGSVERALADLAW